MRGSQIWLDIFVKTNFWEGYPTEKSRFKLQYEVYKGSNVIGHGRPCREVCTGEETINDEGGGKRCYKFPGVV